MRSIELFTGAGGLALGTHAAGFRHELLVEWDEDACDTLRHNAEREALPGIKDWRDIVQGDIKDVSFEEFKGIDLVAGGVPCQPFSLGGKHRGMADERNMFPQFARAVRELAPRAFIAENVKGLLRQGFRNYFNYIVLELTYPVLVRRADEDWTDHLRRLEEVHTRGRHRGLRYNVVYSLLNAADYGVPQTRERVFIVGFRADTGLEWHFPEPTHSLDQLLREQYVTGEYWRRHGLRRPKTGPTWAAGRVAALREEELFPETRAWRTVRDALVGLPEPRADRESDRFFNHRMNPGARSYPGHTGSPLDLPSKTLKAGVHGVPGGENTIAFEDGTVRYLTVREAARVQTFPDSWRFEGAWSEAMRQLGNAVPMELAEMVATSVAGKLGGTIGLKETA